MRGWTGAVAAWSGFLVFPFFLMVAAGVLYAQFGDVDVLRRMLGGLAAAAAGLLIATVVKMALPLFKSFGPAPFVALATAGRHRRGALAAGRGSRCARAAVDRAGVVGAAMKDDGAILVTLAFQFAMMSLLAFGGANAVVPEIHRQAVEIGFWMTERQFADLFAISQAAPGPNVMIVTLVGYHVAGFLGALVATRRDVRADRGACLFLEPHLGSLPRSALARRHPGRTRADLGRPRRRERDRSSPASPSTIGWRGDHRRHRRGRLLDALEPALVVWRGVSGGPRRVSFDRLAGFG